MLNSALLRHLSCLSLFLAAASLAPVRAEVGRDGPLVDPGQLVVTGFPGTMQAGNPGDKAPGTRTKLDETHINPDGASLRILDISAIGANQPDHRRGAAEVYSFIARDIGQIFGITFDDAKHRTGRPAPNIYVTATSAYGLHIVLKDKDGLGWPKRLNRGGPDAEWMEGMYGRNGGGPGTIWKIDGVTGRLTVFAQVTHEGRPNSGPGLGNIFFDPVSRHIFVSDLDTGLIHRFDLEGKEVATYDHGIEARPRYELEPIEDDPAERADIKSMSFRPDDPGTWGYTHPGRRVWGVSVRNGRLFYATAEGPEIWSVAITPTGFGADPRREIALPKEAEPYEISDIAFSSDGMMILAQRPPVTGTWDYVSLVVPGSSRVLRFRPAPTGASWQPAAEEYPVGLHPEHRYTSGGIAIGHNHKTGGGLDFGRCEMLWTTGDTLTEAAAVNRARALAMTVSQRLGFVGSIDGLQGIDLGQARAQIAAPQNARFVDFDGLYVDQGGRGQVGSVRALTVCGGRQWEPEYQTAWWAPGYQGEATDLVLEKVAIGTCARGGMCRFEVRMTNTGSNVYVGPLLFRDRLTAEGATLISTGPSPWACSQAGQTISCHRSEVYLKPGRSATVVLAFHLPADFPHRTFENCAVINWLAVAPEADRIRTVQLELARLGYYTGPASGTLNAELAAAIRALQGERGLAATGVIDEVLLTTLFGQGVNRRGDANPVNDRGCGVFNLPAISGPAGSMKVTSGDIILPGPPPSLPPVEKISRVDIAKCPVGTYQRGGACIPACAPGYDLIAGRCETTCTGGRIPVAGRCQCPPGRVFDRNVWSCVVPAPEATSCPSNLVRSGGDCVCPASTRWSARADACVPVQVGCPLFHKVVGGRCLPVIATCPAGTERVGGTCVAIRIVEYIPRLSGRCGDGQVWSPGGCRCGYGSVNVRGSCQSLSRVPLTPLFERIHRRHRDRDPGHHRPGTREPSKGKDGARPKDPRDQAKDRRETNRERIAREAKERRDRAKERAERESKNRRDRAKESADREAKRRADRAKERADRNRANTRDNRRQDTGERLRRRGSDRATRIDRTERSTRQREPRRTERIERTPRRTERPSTSRRSGPISRPQAPPRSRPSSSSGGGRPSFGGGGRRR